MLYSDFQDWLGIDLIKIINDRTSDYINMIYRCPKAHLFHSRMARQGNCFLKFSSFSKFRKIEDPWVPTKVLSEN